MRDEGVLARLGERLRLLRGLTEVGSGHEPRPERTHTVQIVFGLDTVGEDDRTGAFEMGVEKTVEFGKMRVAVDAQNVRVESDHRRIDQRTKAVLRRSAPTEDMPTPQPMARADRTERSTEAGDEATRVASSWRMTERSGSPVRSSRVAKDSASAWRNRRFDFGSPAPSAVRSAESRREASISPVIVETRMA